VLQSDFKDRRWSIAIAALCLAVGLMLPEIVHPAKGLGLDMVDFVRGLLIGLSLSINLSGAEDGPQASIGFALAITFLLSLAAPSAAEAALILLGLWHG